MTKAEIRAELSNRGFDGFQPSDLDRYINWGYFYLARKLRLHGMEQPITFSIAAGGYTMDLTTLSPVPKSIRRVVVATAGQEEQILPLDDRSFWKNWAPFGFSGAGATIDVDHVADEPQWYFIYNNLFIVIPALSTAKTFVISTWEAVGELVEDGDTYILPQDYEEILLASVMRVCHIRANEVDRAQALEGQIDEQIRDLITEDVFQTAELQDQVERDDSWW